MIMKTVHFRFCPGVKGDPFPNKKVFLEGSWNDQGVYTDHRSSVEMNKKDSSDGGVIYQASVNIQENQNGHEFRWGVRLKDMGTSVETWGVASEAKSTTSNERYRSFIFGGESTETYRLTNHRYLGANKYLKSNGSWGTKFRVWAPNALSVEVVFGALSNHHDPEREELNPGESLEPRKLAGGYISNDYKGMSKFINPIPMNKLADGVWETPSDHQDLQDLNLLQHRLYMFRIKRDDNSVVLRSDLYSRCQIGYGATDPNGQEYNGPVSHLAGKGSCSVTVDPEKVVSSFSVPVWPEPDAELVDEDVFWADEFTNKVVPKKVEDLIIYELHLGALGYGDKYPGTLEDAIELLDYLESLNVNTIELLPLSEFAGGGDNWGYATSHYFAIEYSGGGRDKFKHFVKECHKRGMAVIMDVVYNHYDHHADRAQRYFDSPNPSKDIYYWYEGTPDQYRYLEHEGWNEHWHRGGYIENQSTGDAPAYHEEFVRKMFISSAIALLLEFHVDGFRVDQTTSIHAYNKVGAYAKDNIPASNVNIFGGKFLHEFGRTLRLFKPNVMFMAEDHSDWDQITKPVEEGGIGFDAQWYSDFYHHLCGDTSSGGMAKLLKNAATFGAGVSLHMDRFSGALWASQFDKIVYNESHDEAGNSSGPFVDPDWNGRDEGKDRTSLRTILVAVNDSPLFGKTRHYAEARCRFAWGVTALSAGTPMFLFGEEVGAEKRFKYNNVIENKEDLHSLQTGTGKHLYRFYSEVNDLRLKNSAIKSKNIDIVYIHNDHRVIAFKRSDSAGTFLVVASLSDHPHFNYSISSRIESGRWKEVFNSDASVYGGDNVGNNGATLLCNQGHLQLTIPFAGFVVFQLERM